MSGPSIADLCDVEDGLTTCEMYRLADLIVESSPVHQPSVRYVRPSTIQAYCTLWGLTNTAMHRRKYIRPVITMATLEQQFPQKYALSLSPKIIACGNTHFRAFLDRDGAYLAGQGTVILSRFRSTVNPHFLLGVLNSKILKYILRHRRHSKPGRKLLTPSAFDLCSLHIGPPDPAIQTAVAERARAIIFAKQKDFSADTTPLESEIDQQLGSLYGLSRRQLATFDI
jgi:hypothetical protein